MSALKTPSLLQSSSVVASIGARPRDERNALKIAAAALVMSFATLVATPTVHAQQFSGNAPQVVNMDRVPATVVSVKKISPRSDRFERRSEVLENRGNRLFETAVGGLLGGWVGDQVGNGRGRGYARAAGAIAGGALANRVSAWRHNRQNAQQDQYGNIRAVEDKVLVTVSVNLGGTYEQYAIEQPAGVRLRAGEEVYLMPSNDGRDVAVVPQYSTRRYGR